MEEQSFRAFYAWFEEMKEQIRFRPDHEAIKREIESHYSDHYHDLRRRGLNLWQRRGQFVPRGILRWLVRLWMLLTNRGLVGCGW